MMKRWAEDSLESERELSDQQWLAELAKDPYVIESEMIINDLVQLLQK